MGAPRKTKRRPLRIVHVTWGLQVGGLEKLLVEFAKHADRDATQLHFVSLSDRGVLADQIESHGWPVHALHQPEGLRPRMVLQLADVMRRWKADVVHTHNTRALVYGGPAARLAGVRRVIHTWHGLDFDGSARKNLLLRVMSQTPDWIVAVSRDAAELLRGKGAPPRKLRVILNGIDLDRFSPTGPSDNETAVCVARLSPEKDIGTLLKAVGEINDRPKFRLKIAGDGACMADLRSQANQLSLGDRVQFLGRVDDVPALLQQARLFVLSSLTEGVSLTILEAMARGLPVVATAVGGNPETVQHGETGLLVPAREPRQLATAMCELMDDRERCRQMGQAGRRRVEAVFNVRRMVQDYEALYAPKPTFAGGGVDLYHAQRATKRTVAINPTVG